MSASESTVVGGDSPSGRVARRRHRMREALLRAGARQFAARGIGTVSVEELLAEADVSRATFYGFFSSKYSLLEELLHPIFKDGVAAVTALEKRPAREALVGITCVYLDLWRAHREGLALIPTMDSPHRRLRAAATAVKQGCTKSYRCV